MCIRDSTSDYNCKRLVPELYNLKGPRKERALREWLRVYHETNLDMYALIHKSKGKYKERKISYQEQQYLLHLLLNPNRIKVGSATVSYTHLRAHETVLDLVCRLLLEKKNKQITKLK